MTEDFQLRTIEHKLERLRFCCKKYLTPEMIDAVVDYDSTLNLFVVRAVMSELGEKLETRVVFFPDGWWQAFKERWFPWWLRKKFPVRYKIFDVYAIYPKLTKKFPIQGECNFIIFKEFVPPPAGG